MKRSILATASACALFIFVLSSCVTTGRQEKDSISESPIDADSDATAETAEQPVAETLDLTFAGDIMAHTVNFTMSGYDRIYDDVRMILSSDDLTFANFEIPVDESLPMSTYPRFNVHSPYLAASIAGGFDVFSVANNHSNDQGSSGIRGTIRACESFSRKAFFSGLRSVPAEKMRPVVIRKNGWTVLFLAVTEILNSHDAAGKLVYQVSPTEIGRARFLADLAEMRKENPCDIFVLSLHSNEPEYVRKVSPEKKAWFRQLADSGVDIVWAHHPHVMQQWETIDSGNREALVMYSMGNFVSGQRLVPDRENPGALREYTGDGVLLKARFSRKAHVSGYESVALTPLTITNWNDPRGGVVVRQFSQTFIQSLPAAWQKYYSSRYSFMHAYLPLLPVSPVTAILEE